MEQKRRFFGKRDGLVVGAILLVAALTYQIEAAASAKSAYVEAEIYHNSQVVRTIALDSTAKGQFSVSGCVIQVDGKKIRFLSSTCPDKICVRDGYLDSPGETAICLPHRVAVKIVGSGNAGGRADTYAYGS